MAGISISGRKIQSDIEKRILSNLITNTDYARQIIPVIEADTFETPYIRRLSNYIIEYFKTYQESPGKTIQAIFNVKKEKMSPEDSELISDLLSGLSNEFEKDKDERPNTEYLVQTAKDYLNKRHFAVLGERLQAFAKLGEIKECEQVLLKHKSVSVSDSKYINLHDPTTVKTILANRDSDILFRMDGVLGELIGDIRKGQLIGVLGRTNIGKSFFLREIMFQALLNRIKCAEFNFEMMESSIGIRHYKRILGLGDEGKQQLYPVFDCKLNVFNSCQSPDRKCKVGLINNLGDIPSYGDHNPLYSPCSVCRGKNKNYEASVWYEPIYKKAIDSGLIENGVRGFQMMFGDNLRTVCWPRYSATIKDCEHQLDMMEYNEGFIPEFSIWDYDEIVKPETNFDNPMNASDEIYKNLCGLLQRRKMGGFIGMQLNRTGAAAKKGSIFSVSNDFKKIMHLDGVLILSASDREKEAGILNVSVGKARDSEFIVSKEVQVLTHHSTGQSNLDSEWINYNQD